MVAKFQPQSIKAGILLFAVALLAISGCHRPDTTVAIETRSRPVSQELHDNNSTPTVDLSTYTLIADSGSDRSNDAKEVLAVKRRWPLAMQSLDAKEFEAILSKHFTFQGRDEFFNRADYIVNRTTPDDWKITFVKYDNVTLQFVHDVAILSYRNHIRNENPGTHETETENIAWVDIYVKEDGAWKIGSAHVIDYEVVQ